MKLNEEHIKKLIALVNQSPFFQLLSMTIENMGVGFSQLRIGLERKHLSPYMAIQGGVYSALIDAAAYWAVYAELPEEAGLITMDVTVNNLSSIKEGTIMATGRRIKVGRSICLADVRVEDSTGRILSHGTSKLLVTQGLQPISQIAELAGTSLPPKFL
ncbi:MAG: PaaI family thioesterase [Syntrophomonadaceae bacterium]|nr:PaaI family thioesterase [Syntrophomonadaceae bacterium]